MISQQHPLFLHFLNPVEELAFRKFVRQSIAPFVAVGFFVGAINDILLFTEIKNELSLFLQWQFITTVSIVIVVSIVMFFKRSVFIEHGYLCVFFLLLEHITFCAIWGQVAGFAPGLLFFMYYISFAPLPFYFCPLFIVLLGGSFYMNLTEESLTRHLNTRLIWHSFSLCGVTAVISMFLESTFRKYFAALRAIASMSAEKHSDDHSDPGGRDSPPQEGEVELLRSSLKTMQSMNATLKAKTEQVQRALQVKELFMAAMSHEIRSPLHAVVALSNLLMESVSLNSNEQSMLRTIHMSSQHLITIVNDILDYTKMQVKKLELVSEPFHLHTFVESVMHMTSPLMFPGVILVSTVNTTSDVQLFGDASRLKQICCNLMSNAAKFTHNGSVGFHVEVEDGPLQDDPNRVLLTMRVSDTGIGMSEEYMKRMYTPFEQSDNTISRKYGGTGLGLVITKQLIELFEGEISCESALGVGTKLTVKIPLRKHFTPSSKSPSPCFSPIASSPTKKTAQLVSPVAVKGGGGSNFSPFPSPRHAQQKPPLWFVPAANCIASHVFVIDIGLAVPIQNTVRHWLELAGAVVIGEADFMREKHRRKLCSSSNTLRRRKTTAQEGEQDDLVVEPSFPLPPSQEEEAEEKDEVVVINFELDEEALVIGICSEEREDILMESLGANSQQQGRALVIKDKSALATAAVLRSYSISPVFSGPVDGKGGPAAAAAGASSSSSSSSSRPDGKWRSSKRPTLSLPPSSASSQQQHVSSLFLKQLSQAALSTKQVEWWRVGCELPLTGRSILRAAAKVIMGDKKKNEGEADNPPTTSQSQLAADFGVPTPATVVSGAVIPRKEEEALASDEFHMNSGRAEIKGLEDLKIKSEEEAVKEKYHPLNPEFRHSLEDVFGPSKKAEANTPVRILQTPKSMMTPSRSLNSIQQQLVENSSSHAANAAAALTTTSSPQSFSSSSSTSTTVMSGTVDSSSSDGKANKISISIPDPRFSSSSSAFPFPSKLQSSPLSTVSRNQPHPFDPISYSPLSSAATSPTNTGTGSSSGENTGRSSSNNNSYSNSFDSAFRNAIEKKKRSTTSSTASPSPSSSSSRSSSISAALRSNKTPQTQEFSHLRVLMVDDNSINRKVGEQLLKRCGVVEIQNAENGKEAVEAVEAAKQKGRDHEFDVILMDLHMPVMDGGAAAREIARNRRNRTQRPIVIACTADVFAETNETMPLAITKPFTALQLGQVLREAMERFEPLNCNNGEEDDDDERDDASLNNVEISITSPR